jgi:D-psicose/D-tagatose/L-ribulose 3-epimerase
MLLSISNIAWNNDEEDDMARFLRSEGIARVDIAPGRYFTDPERASASDVANVRAFWQDRGFTIQGMQALLFGTIGLNLFDDGQGVMFRRLAAICRIGGGLGARALTFGSPRQRDRGDRPYHEAAEIAVDFFSRLGDVAEAEGVTICLEPNPSIYHCNFMVCTDEAAAIVRDTDHPTIRLQLDVGALALNGEGAEDVVSRHADLIGHVHASEPRLVVLGDGGASHETTAAALRRHRPELVVTVEMAAATKEPHRDAVARSLRIAKRFYGSLAE